MKTIQYKSNSEMWKLEKELKSQGFVKTSDCFWYQNYKRGNERVTLERA
jgi:hypothetical protein